MSKIISASINLEKIDKSRITTDKNGKGKYYAISIIVNDNKDQYGNDTSISAGQTKDERDAKAQRVYLGNGKTVWQGESNKPSGSGIHGVSEHSTNDDLPF